MTQCGLEQTQSPGDVNSCLEYFFQFVEPCVSVSRVFLFLFLKVDPPSVRNSRLVGVVFGLMSHEDLR